MQKPLPIMPPGPFIILSEVDSTNNYAMAKLHAFEIQAGSCFQAVEQTAGKGQRGRRWQAAKGDNITMSVCLKPAHREFPFLLSAAMALSCYDFIKECGLQDIAVKWPNDVFIGDRKAAGILVENMIRGRNWQFAIAGFGININQTEFLPAAKRPVSLKQITGETYNAVELAKTFCGLLNERIKYLHAGRGQEILSDYNRHLYRLNETENFRYSSVSFPAVIKGVNESGNIILDSGIKKPYRSGEIEWII